MQTAIYNISFKDGSSYNIFCANSKQNKDMISFLHYKKSVYANYSIVCNGIHTMAQFKKITKA